jgi:hypothetical protein
VTALISLASTASNGTPRAEASATDSPFQWTSTAWSCETWKANPTIVGFGAIGTNSVTKSSVSESSSMASGVSAVLNATA